MAESTLSQVYTSIFADVAESLGHSRTTVVASEVASIASYIAEAERRVYGAHDWSFLVRWDVINTQAPYATGTIAIASGVVTLTGGTFPSWAANAALTVNGQPYDVSTRDGNTQVTLLDTSLTVASGTAYSLSQWDYELSDYVGEVLGKIHFAPNLPYEPIQKFDEASIFSLRQRTGVTSGRPTAFCVRWSTAAIGTTGQRFVVSFDRPPDAAYVLSYRARVNPSAVSGSNYPYGGMRFASLIRAAALDVADEEGNDNPGGPKHAIYLEQLQAAIAADSRSRADSVGYMTDPGIRQVEPPRLVDYLTIDGVRAY